MGKLNSIVVYKQNYSNQPSIVHSKYYHAQNGVFPPLSCQSVNGPLNPVGISRSLLIIHNFHPFWDLELLRIEFWCFNFFGFDLRRLDLRHLLFRDLDSRICVPEHFRRFRRRARIARRDRCRSLLDRLRRRLMVKLRHLDQSVYHQTSIHHKLTSGRQPIQLVVM